MKKIIKIFMFFLDTFFIIELELHYVPDNDWFNIYLNTRPLIIGNIWVIILITYFIADMINLYLFFIKEGKC